MQVSTAAHGRWYGRLIRKVGLATVIVGLTGCAAPNIWARNGVSAMQTSADQEACTAIAEGRGGSAPGYSDGTVVGQAAAGAAAGATGVIAELRARDACIESRGYRRLTITSEERSRENSLRGAERIAYRQQLLEKYGVVGPSAATPPADAQPIR